MINIRSKSIDFPEVVLDALAEYKKTTGMSASDYIRNATCRRMITDKILKIKIKEVEILKEEDMIHINLDAINANSFCDGDKCEIPVQLPPRMPGGCG